MVKESKRQSCLVETDTNIDTKSRAEALFEEISNPTSAQRAHASLQDV